MAQEVAHEIDLTRGMPPQDSFPTREIAALLATVTRSNPGVVLQYADKSGYQPLRERLAEEYGVTPDHVMVGNGSLQLLDLLAQELGRDSSPPHIITEEPTYDRAITTFRRHSYVVTGIPLEQDGVAIAPLAEALLSRRGTLYLIPDFQNPTGITMSEEKRRTAMELVQRANCYVIEDVPYRKLRYDGQDLPLLRTYAPRHVITLSSYSKTLCPGLRVGYMIAPPELVKRVTALAVDTYLSPVLVTQAIVAQLSALEHALILRGLISRYAPRRTAMYNAVRKYLPAAHVVRPDGGFFVGVTIPSSENPHDLVKRAKGEQRLLFNPANSFFPDGKNDGSHFFRLPFCSLDIDQIEESVRRLAKLFKN